TMTKPKSFIYKLMFNVNLFERKDELIWGIKVEGNRVPRYATYKGRRLGDTWPEDVTVVVSGDQPVDYFSGFDFDVVSDRVRDIIIAKWPDNVEFLPVQIVRQENGERLGPYWVINVLKIIEGLDEENTYWARGAPPAAEEQYPALGIIKFALKESLVRNEGIFGVSIRGQIRIGAKFINYELKRDLEKADARLGMSFAPVRCT
ncbi:MAG: DUF1629 domain-containing protein, partial [Anaerolineaceae bacterium]